MKRFFFLFLSLLFFLSCRNSSYVTFSGYAQGGVWQVKCDVRTSDMEPESIQRKLDSLLSKIDFSLSGYNKNSTLSRHLRGENPSYDSLFLTLLDLSGKFFRLSEGKVDVSAAELFDAWGFGFRSDSLPSPEKVAFLLAQKGSLGEQNGSFLLTRPDNAPQSFNFNAIAQGYSCDVLASYLRGIGVENMMVNVGGEMYCSGLNPSGQPWTLGIDAPYDGNENPGESLSRVFSLGQGPCGVVTSGNYRKFYLKDGVKYSHTIDPSTGYPVQHDLLSATVVVNPTCPLVTAGGDFENYPATLADALATYFMVIGREAASAFVDSWEGIEACLIYGNSQDAAAMLQWTSPGF